MEEMWELLGKWFNIAVIIILRAILGKVDNLQEPLSQVGSKMGTLRKQ